MSEATPRVQAQHLERFIGRTVRILGKVLQLRGEAATIEAGGNINVMLNRDAHFQVGHAVELIGKVGEDLSVKMLGSTDLGTNIDFQAVSAVVDATHRHSEIFYEK